MHRPCVCKCVCKCVCVTLAVSHSGQSGNKANFIRTLQSCIPRILSTWQPANIQSDDGRREKEGGRGGAHLHSSSLSILLRGSTKRSRRFARMKVRDLVMLRTSGAVSFGVLSRSAASAFTGFASRLTALVLTADVHLPSWRRHFCR